VCKHASLLFTNWSGIIIIMFDKLIVVTVVVVVINFIENYNGIGSVCN
jgi:hypothetical protein